MKFAFVNLRALKKEGQKFYASIIVDKIQVLSWNMIVLKSWNLTLGLVLGQ